MNRLAETIEHVVVLMLENRSFDSLLGYLYPRTQGAGFDGLRGTESNPATVLDRTIPVWRGGGPGPGSMCIPDPDPGELWADMNEQLFGAGQSPGRRPPPMNGFVDNYLRQQAPGGPPYRPESVMHAYDPAQVPVLSTLARGFAVCDQWFASAPCQTWPNRFFLHTGTASGYENNLPLHFPYLMPTIFNRLEERGKTWQVYFHDIPQTLILSRLWPHLEHFRRFEDEFAAHARAGRLPAYSFIEPRYFPLEDLPNDQHPPHRIDLGERLLRDVYLAVRGSPCWPSTLLIVIYDEHGGSFDHVPPPTAVPPERALAEPFAFDRYGVRVPAVLISPWIAPGTILQAAPVLPHVGPPYPFDHTSVLSTLRRTFDLGDPLSLRDAVAPDLNAALNLPQPTNGGPALPELAPRRVDPDELRAALAAPMNNQQRALHEAAGLLPAAGWLDRLGRWAARLGRWLARLLGRPAPLGTRGEGAQFVHQRVRRLLGR